MHQKKALNIVNSCYKSCVCECANKENEFDLVVSSEVVNPISLHSLCRSNIGWFSDKSVCEHHIKDWHLGHTNGLYILWHKNNYCNKHNLFHMRALYVGKENIAARFSDHWDRKDFSEELFVYFTYVEMSNRLSKYFEQVLLDLYDFPLNKSENTGCKVLCQHFYQWDVD